MDFISEFFSSVGTIPAIIGIALLALLGYSIVTSKNGKSNGGNSNNSTQ